MTENPSSKSLLALARESLEANILVLPGGSYLTAGRNQFKTLWTRDFCLSARGLLGIGRSDVLRSHLGFLLEHRREDGLIPRVIDSMPVAWRVTRQFLARMVPEKIRWFDPDPPIREPLRPEFVDEHGTSAIDSNLLALLAALQYVEATGDRAWWSERESAWRQVYRYYDAKEVDGLIVQGRFADWQDSVRREGRTFYTNLLYWVVSDRLGRMGWELPAGFLSDLRKRIVETFRDPSTGLYLSLAGHPQLSADGNLLAIDLGFHAPDSPEARALWSALRAHDLWKGPADFPGRVTTPAYPPAWKSIAVRFAGLRNYHEDLHWSWLMGLAAKVASLMGDREEALRIRGTLETLARRDGAIGEIFFPRPGLPLWSSRFFRSEIPFSWGSAFIIDACLALGTP